MQLPSTSKKSGRRNKTNRKSALKVRPEPEPALNESISLSEIQQTALQVQAADMELQEGLEQLRMPSISKVLNDDSVHTNSVILNKYRTMMDNIDINKSQDSMIHQKSCNVEKKHHIESELSKMRSDLNVLKEKETELLD